MNDARMTYSEYETHFHKTAHQLGEAIGIDPTELADYLDNLPPSFQETLYEQYEQAWETSR